MSMESPRLPRYSEEQLSAWADGEGAEIEAWLLTHPEEAALVQAWANDREALHAAFASVVHEPVPLPLAETVARPRAWWPWSNGRSTSSSRSGPAAPAAPAAPTAPTAPTARLAAAAAALFLLGGLSGAWVAWQWKEGSALARGAAAPAAMAAAGWLQRAAFAHSVYTPEPRHAVEVKAQEEHLARWLTRRIEAPVKLFDLRPLGFELVGGRLLPDGAGKSAQLMYQDANGQRVTVYLRKPEPGTDAAFRYERQGALGMFYWIEDKCGFALVGELPKERLLALAKSIYDQDATLPAPSLTPPVAPSSAAASTPGK